jgi:hypothetical protein
MKMIALPGPAPPDGSLNWWGEQAEVDEGKGPAQRSLERPAPLIADSTAAEQPRQHALDYRYRPRRSPELTACGRCAQLI